MSKYRARSKIADDPLSTKKPTRMPNNSKRDK